MPAALARFLAAVEARDAEAAGACFAGQATYANVPHPPVVGPEGVRGLLAPILDGSEHVRWEIVTAALDERRCFLERVDRFVIGGREYAVACTAVVEIDPEADRITAFRDYVDLGAWRARLAEAL